VTAAFFMSGLYITDRIKSQGMTESFYLAGLVKECHLHVSFMNGQGSK